MAHISGLGAFFIIVLIVVIIAAIAWVVYTQLRARRLGLPPPTVSSYNPFNRSSDSYGAPGPRRSGPISWVKSQFSSIKNRNTRTAGGAYEEPLNNVSGRGNTRGFGPLDPDDAWDARVNTEAEAYGPGGYYGEQESGAHGDARLAPTPGIAPAGFGDSGSRGRSLSREPEPYIGGSQAGLDRRYDEEMGRRPPSAAQNPFDDSAAVPGNTGSSMRGVSPRPINTNVPAQKSQDSGESPTERRSMFRENM